MLTKEDLQAISDLMDAKIEASQQQTMAYIDQKVEDNFRQTMVYIENAVLPKLDLLAEGQQIIRETLAPKNRVEALEEEVDFLKQIIKGLGSRISELEKKAG